MSYAVGIALCAVGVLLGIILARRLGPRPDGGAAEQERQRLLQAALTEADQIKRDAQVQSKEILLRAQEIQIFPCEQTRFMAVAEGGFHGVIAHGL